MRAAVIDIGSNTLKVLVAEKESNGTLREVLAKTLDVRISKGIGSGAPRLSDESVARALVAIEELAKDARREGADLVTAVATSAVRDAANGPEFRERVRSLTGIEVRILSGDEEAHLIGRGLTTDPALASLKDFNVYDLGGGSLECIAFRDRAVTHAVSLPLGCVRLTEMLVSDAHSPFSEPEAQRVRDHVEAVLRKSGFPLAVPPRVTAVGCGGTVTTARLIRAAHQRVALAQTASTVEVLELRMLLNRIGALSLEGRKKIEGLAGARADVYPTALLTLLTLADLGGFPAYTHSLRNLRWGLAASLLENS